MRSNAMIEYFIKRIDPKTTKIKENIFNAI